MRALHGYIRAARLEEATHEEEARDGSGQLQGRTAPVSFSQRDSAEQVATQTGDPSYVSTSSTGSQPPARTSTNLDPLVGLATSTMPPYQCRHNSDRRQHRNGSLEQRLARHDRFSPLRFLWNRCRVRWLGNRVDAHLSATSMLSPATGTSSTFSPIQHRRRSRAIL